MSLDVIQKETTWDYSVSSMSELGAQKTERRSLGWGGSEWTLWEM